MPDASITAASAAKRNSIVALWGASGVIAICAFAVWRLSRYTIDALELPLSGLQWALLVANVAFMAWSEGYRGFQLKFSPRAAARALYLYRTPTGWRTKVLAPLFCFGYFGAARRVRIVTWSVTAGIVVLVLLVHQLNQPWRGIIDAGVVVGLSWGIVSLVVCYFRAFSSGQYPASPEVE
jgi:hypothetical protein